MGALVGAIDSSAGNSSSSWTAKSADADLEGGPLLGAIALLGVNSPSSCLPTPPSGCRITTLYTQSPNSPDTNICDLGFFRAIQSASLIVGSNEKALIDAVTKAFNEYPKEKLNRTWLTLQSCFNMIIEEDGGNDYKIPHMNKEGLERIGQLPTVLDVTGAFTANNNLHLLE